MFGAIVQSAAGREGFLCSVEQPKAGYVSLHFRIVIPIREDAPVAPPEHTNPLSFVEEVRTIGHALKLYAYRGRGTIRRNSFEPRYCGNMELMRGSK